MISAAHGKIGGISLVHLAGAVLKEQKPAVWEGSLIHTHTEHCLTAMPRQPSVRPHRPVARLPNHREWTVCICGLHLTGKNQQSSHRLRVSHGVFQGEHSAASEKS